jgi:hypothetical protein
VSPPIIHQNCQSGVRPDLAGCIWRWGHRVGRVAQRSWTQATAKRLRAVTKAGWALSLSHQALISSRGTVRKLEIWSVEAAPNLPYKKVPQDPNTPDLALRLGG